MARPAQPHAQDRPRQAVQFVHTPDAAFPAAAVIIVVPAISVGCRPGLRVSNRAVQLIRLRRVLLFLLLFRIFVFVLVLPMWGGLLRGFSRECDSRHQNKDIVSR